MIPVEKEDVYKAGRDILFIELSGLAGVARRTAAAGVGQGWTQVNAQCNISAAVSFLP